jgi:diguanylate cyclase (GGDEF)-like protein
MYALISGDMIVVDHAPDQDDTTPQSISKILTRVRAGDLIGEMGLLRRAPRSATIIASGPCELLQINLKMIQRLQWLYPPMALTFNVNLMTILCDKLEMTSKSLIDSSFTDDLTGLWNRRTFMENLSTEAYRSRRYDSDLTVCLLQVDGNGTGGPAGKANLDEDALKSFSAVLNQSFRKSDGIGRTDNDTFAFMLPQTRVVDAHAILNRTVQALYDTFAGQESADMKMALGLAAYRSQDDETAEDLYARALQNMRYVTLQDKPA